jgi:hypothetical protein
MSEMLWKTREWACRNHTAPVQNSVYLWTGQTVTHSEPTYAEGVSPACLWKLWGWSRVEGGTPQIVVLARGMLALAMYRTEHTS